MASNPTLERARTSAYHGDYQTVMHRAFGETALVRAGSSTAPFREYLAAFMARGYPVQKIYLGYVRRKESTYDHVIDGSKLPKGWYYIDLEKRQEAERAIASAIVISPGDPHSVAIRRRMLKGILEKSGLPTVSVDSIMAMVLAQTATPRELLRKGIEGAGLVPDVHFPAAVAARMGNVPMRADNPHSGV